MVKKWRNWVWSMFKWWMVTLMLTMLKNLLDIFLKLHPARRLLPLPVIAFNLPRSHDWHCGNDRDNCFDDINLISLSSQKRGWGSWTPSAISPKISLPAMFKICFPAISKNLPPRNVWKSPSNKNIQKAVRDPASYRFFTRNPNQVVWDSASDRSSPDDPI